MEACWAHNPEVRGSKPRSAKYFGRSSSLYAPRSLGVVVITSALHAEGPQFDPGRDQFCLFLGWKILGERNLESNSTCQVGRVV